jgi:hypothetical protein
MARGRQVSNSVNAVQCGARARLGLKMRLLLEMGIEDFDVQ